MTAGTDHVLEVEHLQVQLKSNTGLIPLLEPLHFKLQKGRILGIVGESGSGKSLTCHAILRLLQPRQMEWSGTVRLNGRDLGTLSDKEMRTIRGKEIGSIMQNPMNAFTPVYTIGSQFVETLRTHTRISKQQAIQQAIEALASMNLPDPHKLLKKYPFQLSGGMLQRVMIAISMCLKPSLLIADEPTTALDVVNQLQVLRELDRLRYECGTSIVLVSHDLGVISQLADEVVVMYKGQIVEQGEVTQIFDQPQHEYTQMLLRSRPTAIIDRLSSSTPIEL